MLNIKTSTHLQSHGQSYFKHFLNNWKFTKLAFMSAFFTLGHGLTPRISGQRATELHNQLWDEGRTLSLEDLNHRLNSNYYRDKQEAIADYENYCNLYNEKPRIKPFIDTINRKYQTGPDSELPHLN